MASDEDRLIEIVRECVRNEMALQRSESGSGSNASLLSRTRNLFSNTATSASREPGAPPPPSPGEGGGYSLIWAILVCAAPKGTVFQPLWS